jgi:hypothetical protein
MEISVERHASGRLRKKGPRYPSSRRMDDLRDILDAVEKRKYLVREVNRTSAVQNVDRRYTD